MLKLLKLERRELLPLLVFGAVFLLSAALLVHHYHSSIGRLDKEFVKDRTQAARFTAREIKEFLEHESVTLDNIAKVISLSGGIEKGEAPISLIYKSHKRQPRLFTYIVMDVGGRFLYSVPESMEDRYMQDLSGEEYFYRAKRKKGFYNSGMKPDKNGDWDLWLSTAIIGKDGSVTGVIAEKISARAFDQLFLANADPGPGGSAFLVDESGRLLAGQKGGRLYEIVGSDESIRRMMKGEEGSHVGEGWNGTPEMTVFSPMTFSGRSWSLGITSTSFRDYTAERDDLLRTLSILTLMVAVFAWSVVSFGRSRRYRERLKESTKVWDSLVTKNRELTAINDFSRALGGCDNLDRLLELALSFILDSIGAGGCAVRLVSQPAGELVLKSFGGAPVPFVETRTCPSQAGCACARALSSERPFYLEKEHLKSGAPPCGMTLGGGFVLVPLRVQKRHMGVLYLWGMKREDLSEEREGLLMAFANHLSSYMETILQIEDTKRYAARASALFQVAQAIARTQDLDELFRIIMKEAAGLLKAGRCLLFLYSEESGVISYRVSLGFNGGTPEGLTFGPADVFWHAMRDGGLKIVDMGERNHEVPKAFTDAVDFRRFAVVPLISRGRVLGFIVPELSERGKLEVEDIKMLVGFANQAAVAIENSSYYIRTIEKYNEELQQISTTIIVAQEEERKRISRDLHDELGQSLSALKINLEMLKKEIPESLGAGRDKIDRLIAMATSLIESVRRLSFELRPSMLDDLGLVTALGKLIHTFTERTGIKVVFEHEGMRDRLPPELEVALYRIVQEGLTNVVKHSQAGEVEVGLGMDYGKDAVLLSIEDDGKGFEPREGNPDYRGFGLLSMKERASIVGGNFRILTEKGKGTKIMVEVPVLKGDINGNHGKDTVG